MAKKRTITNPNFLVEEIDGKLTLKVKDGGINRKVSSSENNSGLNEFMLSVTYSELKQLCDNSKLIPGMQYRITDYECKTIQVGTQGANHPFDIIVTADSKDALNENARAIAKIEQRPTFNLNGYITYEGVRYDIESRWYYDGDEYVDDAQQIMSLWLPEDPSSGSMFGDNPRLYTLQGVIDIQDIMTDVYIKMNYTVMPFGTFFQFVQPAEVYPSSGMDYNNQIVKPMLYWKNSKLEAWELKYCIDNDVNRFEWAPSKSIGYDNDGILFWQNKTRIVGDETYYQWKTLSGDHTYYTLSPNPQTGDQTYWFEDDVIHDGVVVTKVYEDGKGVIYYMKDEYGNECPYDFKNIMFYNSKESLGWLYTFTKGEHDASLLKDICQNNKILYNEKSIKLVVFNFTNICSGNTFGSDCENILVKCNSCKNNTFINNISDLKFINGDDSFSDNVIYPGNYNNYIISSETIGKILCLNNGSPVVGELTIN